MTSLSLYPHSLGDHKGCPALDSEDTSQTSLELIRPGEPGLALVDGPPTLGQTGDNASLERNGRGWRADCFI